MKIAIIFKSITGNTQILAEAVREALRPEEILYFGGLDEWNARPDPKDTPDLYIVGSWTDKGMCDAKIGAFLQTLRGESIAYFGTAGFGGAKEYYQKLFQNVTSNIDSSNRILGFFFCQGKMPVTVKERYEKILAEHPEDPRWQRSLDNFDRARSHPDAEDCEQVQRWLKQEILPKVERARP